MSWYTAECLYRSELSDSNESEQLCEYRYFLLKADNDQAANEKAWTLAKKKQHTYLNSNGVKTQWVLEAVDTKEVLDEKLSEESEVYYKYFSRPATVFANKKA